MSLNSNLTLKKHRQLIKRKKFLKKTYESFYQELGVSKLKKPVVELGSGGGFLKELYPVVVTSDVIGGDDIDRVFKAEKMPFRSNNVGSFVMLNTFHHIKDPEKALKEMERCLKKGGKAVMVEPFNSFFGRFVYSKFHHEDFNPEGDWKIKGQGRLSDANGAIPWIIFVRDRKIFEKKFSKLKIRKIEPHTPFKYLLSGGLSKPQLLPSWSYILIKYLEDLISPLNLFLGMFVTIEIEKI